MALAHPDALDGIAGLRPLQTGGRLARRATRGVARAVGATTKRHFWRHSTWDALLVSLAVAHACLLVFAPSAPLAAVALWWNANTISHYFIHRPFFHSDTLNRLCSLGLSLVLGLPQTIWRNRHLAHHAQTGHPPGEATHPRTRNALSGQLILELFATGLLWLSLAVFVPQLCLRVYLPGFLAGLALCQLQGYYEHQRGTVSHYGWLYNWLFFNDGYHVEHHTHPGEHWTSLPRRRDLTAQASRWPAILRWLDALARPAVRRAPKHTAAFESRTRHSCLGAPLAGFLDWLESAALTSRTLRRLLLETHEHAFLALLPKLPPVRSVCIVGGGLFPRTALIVRKFLPTARLTILDADAANLRTARRFLDEQVTYTHRWYEDQDALGFDLVIFPLAFKGDRERLYQRPPARAVLIHDWLWRRWPDSAVVSWLLAKRLNLLRG
jgi:fatty acid desaturase